MKTLATTEATEFTKLRLPKIGVVVLWKEPGADLDKLLADDVITHVNRDIVRTSDDLTRLVTALDAGKKNKLSVQRFVQGKWNKLDVDIKPKTYKQIVLDGLLEDRDPVSNLTTLIDKRAPIGPDATTLQCRIVHDGTTDVLIMRFSYQGKDWLFMDSCTVKIGEESTLIKFKDVKRDNDRNIWEWWSRPATDEDEKLLRKITTHGEATLRFHGSTYVHDHLMEPTEVLALRNVLEAYRIRQNLNKNP